MVVIRHSSLGKQLFRGGGGRGGGGGVIIRGRLTCTYERIRKGPVAAAAVVTELSVFLFVIVAETRICVIFFIFIFSAPNKKRQICEYHRFI